MQNTRMQGKIIICVGLLQLFFVKIAIGFSCQGVAKSCSSPEILDYYWRDFYGDIPGDAIPGGKNFAGRATYIGQAYIKGKELLPVTIYHGCKNARTTSFNQELQPDKNIKILCSSDISKFSWIPTTPATTSLITNCQLPIGGSELNEFINIGRVNYNGEITIGKVFRYPLGFKGLWIPNETGHETNFQNYEILAYNCSNNLNKTESTVYSQ